MNYKEEKITVDFYGNYYEMEKNYEEKSASDPNLYKPIHPNYYYDCGCGESSAFYLEDKDGNDKHIYVHCESCCGGANPFYREKK